MTRNKNKKPQPPPNQERNRDRNEGFGRGGRGRGRGRGGFGGRGGGMNDGDGGDDFWPRRGGFRGGGLSGFDARGAPSPTLGREFGRGMGRGRGGWMGRGRGFRGADSGSFTGNFRGGGPVYHPTNEIDFEIQQWNESPQNGRNTPGGRGRGSSAPLRSNERDMPRGRGGRGGRGGHTQKLPPSSSLSSLWHEERPLLRPIKFVRSLETATLFQEAEELLESTAQNPNETTGSFISTADKVSRVFSNTHPHLFDNPFFEVEEGIEEVNFEDLPLVHDSVLNSAPATLTPPTIQEEILAGVIQNPAPEPEVRSEETSDATLATTQTTTRIGTKVSTSAYVELPGGPMVKAATDPGQLAASAFVEPMAVDSQITITAAEHEPARTLTEPPPLFVVDTNPSTSQTRVPVPAYNIHPRGVSLGGSVNVEAEVEPDSEDDVIVYNAPNPRISTPGVEPITLTNVSFPDHTPSSTPRQINPLRKGKFVHVVGKNARRASGGILGVKRKRLAEHGNFASFGAMIAEARLRSQDDENDKDPKEHLRRQGDSDVDWGDETDESKGDPNVATAEGMDLDPDLVGSGVTTTAMKMFVEGIDANHVTMDDLEDADTEEYSSSDDEMDEGEGEYGTDDEDVERDEEMMLMEEFLAAQDDSDFSDDDELDPRAGFQARLDRLRKKQQKMIEMEDDSEEGETDPNFKQDERGEVDEFIEEALDNYEKNRVARDATFRAIQDGLLDETQPKPSSSKRKDLPTELQEQWEKDRLKKSKRKSERELARLEAALDPLVAKKGGKKSKKAMIAAARLDPSIEIPHRIVDMVSVEQEIRRFLAEEGKNNMVLPACDKGTRKKIHNLAALFDLKSKSTTGALGRYTTLTKIRYSGKNIDERKVTRMMEGFKYRASYDVSDDDWDDMRKGKGKGKGKSKGKGKAKGKAKGKTEKDLSGHLKTREGEVVGHAAPKIDETNVGFVMLASMGWSYGAAIGLSGGLEGPITAVIKKTKLGLGASGGAKF